MADPKKPAENKKPIEKKSAAEINKSEEIRKIANGMKAKGEKPRPITIIAALKAKGVEVSSPQVSMVLKRMGFRPRKRRKSGDLAAVAAAVNKPGKGKSKISVEDLVAAKKAVGRLGGLDRALAAIEALRQFET
jgi:Mrp family chromosome partitioning ATPase